MFYIWGDLVFYFKSFINYIIYINVAFIISDDGVGTNQVISIIRSFDMEKIAHADECEIERSGGRAIMYDADGHEVMNVSDSEYVSNRQLFEVLELMNVAFTRGVKIGKVKKQSEIIKVLGVHDICRFD